MINSASLKSFAAVILLALFAIFPWFEGGETPLGLFLFHTLTLLLFCWSVFTYSRTWIPRFIVYLLPFLFVLLVSTLTAPYKYAAFLEFWDFAVAAIYAIAIFSLLKEQQEELSDLTLYAFATASISALGSLLLGIQNVRIHGTFVNPNDFATFSLLLIILGLFQFEHQTNRNKKILIAILLVLLSVCMALASSRSVFLGGLVFFVLYIFNRRPGKALAIGITAVLVLSIGLLYFRFINFPDPFQYYRFKIWKHSLKGVIEDPYLGVGINMLPYQAARFNFPADVEVGRYARIAKSADNQYFQILAETGFLGFFTFLIGWIAIFFSLRRAPQRFYHFRYSYIVISIICLFTLPLNNTAILFLFLFLILFPISLDPTARSFRFTYQAPGRIAIAVLSFLVFTFCIYLPFISDYEFKQALKATDPELVEQHLQKARRYNPYQPYYQFVFASRLVNSGTDLTAAQLQEVLESLNESIHLNPLESDFYAYRAKIYRKLYEKTQLQPYLQEAIMNYQAAIEHSPYNVFLRAEYAHFLTRIGRYEPATLELSAVVEMEPAYLSARYLLAETKFRAGDVAGAKKALAEADQSAVRYKSHLKTTNQSYTRGLLDDPSRTTARNAKAHYGWSINQELGKQLFLYFSLDRDSPHFSIKLFG